MEHSIFPDTQQINESTNMTPETNGGLSYDDLETFDLYDHLMTTLEYYGLSNDKQIRDSLELALTFHNKDERKDGPYVNHLLRVALNMIEILNIHEPNLISAALLHDIIEDHSSDLVNIFSNNERITDGNIQEARILGEKAITQCTSMEIVELIGKVTNPIILPKQDKLTIYKNHVNRLVYDDPCARAVKLCDFLDNACADHGIIDSYKQYKLDKRYIGLYSIHMAGLFLLDSLVVGKERQEVSRLLYDGYIKTVGRMGLLSLNSNTTKDIDKSSQQHY